MRLKDAAQLDEQLRKIDSRGYKAYKQIAGAYRVDAFTLFIDHVQGDPFAAPSKLRLRLDGERAGFPQALYQSRPRRVALEDYLLRCFDESLRQVADGNRGSGKSGLLAVDRPGQEMLERTAVVVTDEYIEIRLVSGLPARGRKVLGFQAREMLLEELPEAGRRTLYYSALPGKAVVHHIKTKEDSVRLREQLNELDAVAFVSDGALLPRKSGVSDLPLRDGVPFSSPESLRREVILANGDTITGMIIPKGVTLIVGGGYHGKSTLLRALDRGIYDHVPGDGRERVVSDPTGVKIRAEDGRQVSGVDISPFIRDLPGGVNTTSFSSPTASGSTSQAANIAEALEMGTRCLFLDEDTSATNFMVRDMRMQRLVHRDREPIIPFVDRVGQLARDKGISTVLVMGGSGDYFDMADTVIMMDHFRPYDVTDEAKSIANEYPTGRQEESEGTFPAVRPRVPVISSLDPRRRGRVKVRARGLSHLQFGQWDIDLNQVEQLVDDSQTRALGDILIYLKQYGDAGSLNEILAAVDRDIDDQGLDVLSPFSGHPGDYARPRMFEVAAAVNRLRSLKVRSNG